MLPSPLYAERQYLALLEDLLASGARREGRSGAVTRSLFGRQIHIYLPHGFPLLTTKRLHTRSIVAELIWFLRGLTNVAFLNDHGVRIWNEWADASGELGPIYGRQWRSWSCPDGETIDQIAEVLRLLAHDRYSRRMVVSAWNPAELAEMALPPCHCLFQFYVAPDHEGIDRLSCQVYQRSADVFLGLPFNLASYALLTQMVAQVTGIAPGWLRHTLGDAHLYLAHEAQAREQAVRPPRPPPRLRLAPRPDLFEFEVGDVAFEGYAPAPHIAAEVIV